MLCLFNENFNKYNDFIGNFAPVAGDIIHNDDHSNNTDEPLLNEYDDNPMKSSKTVRDDPDNECNKKVSLNQCTDGNVKEYCEHLADSNVINPISLCSNMNPNDTALVSGVCDKKSTITFFCQNLDELKDDYTDDMDENCNESTSASY